MSMMHYFVEWLGEDIGKLFVRWYPVNRHYTFVLLHELYEMPILDVDVLRSWTNAILLCDGDCSLIIFIDAAQDF